MHGDFIHLFVNMFVLHEFGRSVENDMVAHFWGPGWKDSFSLHTCLSLLWVTFRLIINTKIMDILPVSVLPGRCLRDYLYIYLLYPWSLLGLFAIIPIPAILFGVLYLWYSTWASKNQNDIIDHEAHFYGAIAGLLIAMHKQTPIHRSGVFDQFSSGFSFYRRVLLIFSKMLVMPL